MKAHHKGIKKLKAVKVNKKASFIYVILLGVREKESVIFQTLMLFR